MCANERTAKALSKTQEEFEKEVFINNPNIKIIGKYKNSHTKIKCRCKIHNYEWESPAWRISSGETGCPICNSSVGENKVAEILECNNITYIRQARFKNCRLEQPLRFDFYLPSYNICIEYQGEQHYFPVNFRGKGYKNFVRDFELGQKRDNIKREYCKENNILLIEVPYWEKDNIENYLLKEVKNNNVYFNVSKTVTTTGC